MLKPDRCQHLHAAALRQVENLVDNLRHTMTDDGPTALQAIRCAYPGVEQTQVIGDLSHSANCGTRRRSRAALLNGDGRREPVDGIDIRLGALIEELPGID